MSPWAAFCPSSKSVVCGVSGSAAVTCRLLGQAGKKFHNFRLVRHECHACRQFQGSGTFPSNHPRGDAVSGPVPSNAAVMRRFERVVALPDSKLVISLSRIKTLASAGSPVEHGLRRLLSACVTTAGLQHTVNR